MIDREMETLLSIVQSDEAERFFSLLRTAERDPETFDRLCQSAERWLEPVPLYWRVLMGGG